MHAWRGSITIAILLSGIGLCDAGRAATDDLSSLAMERARARLEPLVRGLALNRAESIDAWARQDLRSDLSLIGWVWSLAPRDGPSRFSNGAVVVELIVDRRALGDYLRAARRENVVYEFETRRLPVRALGWAVSGETGHDATPGWRDVPPEARDAALHAAQRLALRDAWRAALTARVAPGKRLADALSDDELEAAVAASLAEIAVFSREWRPERLLHLTAEIDLIDVVRIAARGGDDSARRELTELLLTARPQRIFAEAWLPPPADSPGAEPRVRGHGAAPWRMGQAWRAVESILALESARWSLAREIRRRESPSTAIAPRDMLLLQRLAEPRLALTPRGVEIELSVPESLIEATHAVDKADSE